MWTYKKAEKVMETWVEQITDGNGMIIREYCVAKPYGWFFLYNSRKWFTSRRSFDAYLGNGYVLFDRISGEIVTFSSALSVEECAQEYEQTIPPTRLEMEAEPIPK
jgi:hypothetical protein